MMKNKSGFTLTEVLLAVMVVGLIGVALASLTTAASRESGVGRSKVMLRNNLSLFLRTLRDDINAATYINMGATSGPGNGTLIELCDNKTMLGATIPSVSGMGCVQYTFEKGSAKGEAARSNQVVPSDATRGGIIYRKVNGSRSVALRNVKYVNNYKPSLSSSKTYFSPYFKRVGTGTAGSALDITIITELDSTPPVNDIVEETFLLPNGL